MSRCLLACALTAIFCLAACTSTGDRGGSGSPAASPTVVTPIPPAADMLRRVATQDGASDSTSEMHLAIESTEGKREEVDFRLRRKYTAEVVSTMLEVTAPREETDKALLSLTYVALGRIYEFKNENGYAMQLYEKAIELDDVRDGGFREAIAAKQRLLKTP